MSEALRPLFAPEVQSFLIDAFSYDPVELAAQVKVPVLVSKACATCKSASRTPKAGSYSTPCNLALIPGVNHVLKTVSSDDPSKNLATYANPTLPISPAVVHGITQFAEKIMEE